MSRPENLLGYSFIIKGKVGRERIPLSFLSGCHAFIVDFSSGLDSEFFCPYMVRIGPQIIVFLYVQRACPDLLGSLGRIWVSCHDCSIVLEHASCFRCMVLSLSKPVWFCG